MEATLAQSEKLAAVGQLAAGVAHEINNPLTAIIANAQLLQQDILSQTGLQDKADMEESLDLILQAGARAIQVVRNLLNFARKERYELVATDINENIRQALSLLHHEIIGRSVELVFDPGEIPSIQASPNHLQGVWLNLIVNAMDSFGDTQGNIHIQTSQNGNMIQVKVSDNGKGIPAERISRIFEPFYTTKAPNRGTGLGLSVCHRIVKQHGGHILVDSQIDVGTEFTVVLPVTSS
jgi:two-component system, NtrC family, sensor kinase